MGPTGAHRHSNGNSPQTIAARSLGRVALEEDPKDSREKNKKSHDFNMCHCDLTLRALFNPLLIFS